MTAVTERRSEPHVAPDGPTPRGTALRSTERAKLTKVLRRGWDDARLGAAVAAVVVVAWAVAAGQWMPRGPLTTAQTLWSLGLSLVVGLAAGLAARRRIVILAAPMLFALVFELLRIDLTGPTVDRPQFSTYGILAVVVGRGFYALTSLVPLAWAAAVGAAVARRADPAPSRPRTRVRATLRGARVSVTALVGVALFALAIGVARPASTAAITGPDGEPLEGSVAELITVQLNGREQPLMIRGYDTDNPVLLFLAGGPGGSELGAMRRHLPGLEEHFTVVTWDQRGTGKAYPQLDPTDTITLDGYVDDTVAVTDYLRERFGTDQIFVAGQSWGSTLAVLAVQQAPDRYRALIGVGQMVSQLETDRIFYADTLRWARETGRTGLVDDLVAIGQPPYDRMLDYETALSHEHEVYPYDNSPNHEGEGGFSENFMVDEYSLVEQVHLLAGFMDTFAALYPQLQDIDFRRTATELPVPAFFVQGAHEADGRQQPFQQWYSTLRAPAKDVVYLDTSGHRPMFEQPDAFIAYLVDTVLPRTAS
ncbi:MAG TPA: alpha/beta hydrolase [Acidimicrobiia bacterium]|nr:alpha/beta hydrolase [Acidimicrobiia bacterium]